MERFKHKDMNAGITFDSDSAEMDHVDSDCESPRRTATL